MPRRVCFLIGHRDAPESLFPALLAEVERHISALQVSEFLVGRYGRFDSMAAQAVRLAKAARPDVLLTLLLPYYPAAQDDADGFDGSLYPAHMEDVPKRLAIVRANRYAVEHVEHSDFLIAYACRPASNATALVEYARRRERRGQLQITLLPAPESGPTE